MDYKSQSDLLHQELLGKKDGKLLTSDIEFLKRDPEEEYFMLAVLALKMLHNEMYEDAEYVYEVSAGKLFR